MTKKNRFNLIPDPEETLDLAPEVVSVEETKPSLENTLGQIQVSEDRSQLNVRIKTQLKRQASAKATLEGKSMVDIIEALLETYIIKGIAK